MCGLCAAKLYTNTKKIGEKVMVDVTSEHPAMMHEVARYLGVTVWFKNIITERGTYATERHLTLTIPQANKMKNYLRDKLH